MNERDLSEFVDRAAEMGRFRDMLQSGNKPIFFVSGDSGFGKSSLLLRMVHDCSVQQIRKAELTWSATRNYDYVGIMRKIRDDLGAQNFNEFTRLVNRFTGAESQEVQIKINLEGSGRNSVAQGAKIEGSTINTMANVVIDQMNVLPRTDMAVPEAERMIRLTDLFLQALAAIVANERIVIFFDAVEKMTEETASWVWNELLGAMRDPKFANLRVVQCGQKKPSLSRDMQKLTEQAELGPLGAADVDEYLVRRGVDESSRVNAARWLMAASAGRPDALANMVDAFFQGRD